MTGPERDGACRNPRRSLPVSRVRYNQLTGTASTDRSLAAIWRIIATVADVVILIVLFVVPGLVMLFAGTSLSSC
jgi:hypothetical protein